MNQSDTIYGTFKAMADVRPSLPAIIQDDITISYKELDRLVDKILLKLYASEDFRVPPEGTPDNLCDGVEQPEGHKCIGIVMKHGYMQIAAMLAVLKSGAAYVPAEPFLPKARIEYMMKNAGVNLIIDDDFCSNLKDIPENVALEDRSVPDGIAYILYTSGTTGTPKGVIIENHSVVNYARAFEEEMKVGPGDVMLQYSVCSFDIFVEEVFATLLNGGALAIPTKDIHNGPLEGLMEFCKKHKVSILDGFPYLVADINQKADLLPDTVTLIISGGDVVRANYINNLRGKGVRIYNTYGPSETTVCSNYYRIDNAEALKDGTFPLGKSIKGVQVKVLDENLREVKNGETGEICIYGEGVGHGYLGNPPEQANYVKLPDGTRFYRSGDLGYLLEDGNLAFLHRKDDQVMILGRRVEPEEVENVLNEYRGIDRGIVRAFKDDAGLHYLVAYVVPNVGFTLKGLKEWLASKLVDFMVPEFFVALHNIPLTIRGKVDVEALPVVLKSGSY